MKKTVKKVFVGVLVLCLAFAMVACSGGKNKYVGTWKATSFEMGGTTYGSEQLEQMGIKMTFVFNEDGTASFIGEDGNEEKGGKWEEKDGKIVLTQADSSSDQSMTLSVDGDKLYQEESGAKIVFEKEK